ncbi:MAG: FAD-binding protein, partial [Patescibacteria group bacterium]
HKYQIGQTGKTVKPEVYLGFGVSGAVQHQAGMNKSKYIIAVNINSEAPIFEIADLGIVGDLFEIIPVLTDKF